MIIFEKVGQQKSPEYLRVLVNIGGTYMRTNQIDKAFKFYQKAEQLNLLINGEDHLYSNILLNLADIYQMRG